MALPNYVKFQRGSQTAYNNLINKDDNTLYFIYDAIDPTKGSLYLGDRLISSNVGGAGVNSLAELTDVLVSNASTGDFLVLNSEGKWAAVSAATVAQQIIDAGNISSNIDIDTSEFEFSAVDGKLNLKGYSSASTGMIPVKSELGLSWQAAPIDLSNRVGSLESAVTAINVELEAVDGKIVSAVAAVNHLTYRVVGDLNDATATNVIYLHPNGTSATNNVYDEFMFVDGRLEKLGSFDAPDLSDYATVTAVSALNTTVGDLTNLLNSHTTAISGLDSRISTLESVTGTYVTMSHFNAVVGSLDAINTKSGLSTTATIADNIIELYDRLIWQDIN